MTLAAILLLGISCAAAPLPMAAVSLSTAAPQTAQTEQPAAPGQNSGQAETPAQNPATAAKPEPAPPQNPAAQNQPAHPKRPRKRKANSVNCVTTPDPTGSANSPSPAPASSAPSSGNSDAGTAPASGGKPSAGTASAPTNCPPPKVIVRQGGTTEPSIQLAGGAAGNEAAQLRDTDNRILKSAEDNLARIAGQQLSANQQDMVNQIHQFMDEAKTAMGAGELERARTLASKAQQLSQELIPPQK